MTRSTFIVGALLGALLAAPLSDGKGLAADLLQPAAAGVAAEGLVAGRARGNGCTPNVRHRIASAPTRS
jgi:hypothetical protein